MSLLPTPEEKAYGEGYIEALEESKKFMTILKLEKQQKQICIDNLRNQLIELEEFVNWVLEDTNFNEAWEQFEAEKEDL